MSEGFAKVPRELLQRQGLSGYAKLVYALLLSHSYNGQPSECSRATLAAESGWSEPTIKKAIDELIAAGLVERQRRGQQQPNVYGLNETWQRSEIPLNETSFRSEPSLNGTTLRSESPERNVVSFLNESSLPLERNDVSPGIEVLIEVPDTGDVTASAEADICTAADEELDEPSWLFERYRERIQPEARACPRKLIEARLKRFSVDELTWGIDHFAADAWCMEHNAHRGAAWFFAKDARSEQYLLMEPRAAVRNKGGVFG